MVEVVLDGMAAKIEEGTVQSWFIEEGDPVTEGEDLVEITTEDGSFTIPAPVSGILAEVYFDEGEAVARGEVLCNIDDEEKAEDEDGDE